MNLLAFLVCQRPHIAYALLPTTQRREFGRNSLLTRGSVKVLRAPRLLGLSLLWRLRWEFIGAQTSCELSGVVE